MKPIGIIGYGSLGASLAHALNAAGLLSWIYIRNEEARIQAAELEVPICTSLSDIPIAHHSIILAIPDSAIKEVSD
ncbi:MAG: NAD(P)-binding domain-containing protein, partial [Bacteroidota bacterium]